MSFCRTSVRQVQSHVKRRNAAKGDHPRDYTYGYKKYGFNGLGIGTYDIRKNRLFYPREQPQFLRGEHEPLGSVTRTLSPHWRSFALQDGGVLFLHPSHKQLMMWGTETLRREAAAAGMTSMDHAMNSKIQAILAEHTVENDTLTTWRKRHLWRLLHGEKFRLPIGTPTT